MGMAITVSATKSLDFALLQEKLQQHGLPLSLKMIDQLPAFPDELPEPTWQELRFGSSVGMITLRRVEAGFQLIIWGNADVELQQQQKTLAPIIAELTEGTILL